MQLLRWFAALGAVAMIAAGEPGEGESARFRGSWVPESIQIGTKNAPPESLKSFGLTVEGEVWTMTTQSPKKSRIRIDPSKTPKHLDLFEEVGGKERVTPHLYEYQDDILVVCRQYMQMNAKRPEKIEPNGDFIGVATWKREKLGSSHPARARGATAETGRGEAGKAGSRPGRPALRRPSSSLGVPVGWGAAARDRGLSILIRLVIA